MDVSLERRDAPPPPPTPPTSSTLSPTRSASNDDKTKLFPRPRPLPPPLPPRLVPHRPDLAVQSPTHPPPPVQSPLFLHLGVGNEVLRKDTLYISNLVPAMRNLQKALQNPGLEKQIKLSAPQAASSILGVTFPPSAGRFEMHLFPVTKQLLQFLSETESPLMVNVNPFDTYVDNPLEVALNYVLFGMNKALFHDDGKAYSNLFDATVDALVAAMQKQGFPKIPAAAYAQGIIDMVGKGVGTPMRPHDTVEVFLSNLFDRNKKEGKEFEKHSGIFNVDHISCSLPTYIINDIWTFEISFVNSK
uniref:Glycoside hydrolase family 17 protein n=1 Tax=Musa balbisiana TaxID=52838 RepID=Q1EP14_MUSBA|nr:glycoside hydrolase family 17 protein [Musa balbisiana]